MAESLKVIVLDKLQLLDGTTGMISFPSIRTTTHPISDSNHFERVRVAKVLLFALPWRRVNS